MSSALDFFPGWREQVVFVFSCPTKSAIWQIMSCPPVLRGGGDSLSFEKRPLTAPRGVGGGGRSKYWWSSHAGDAVRYRNPPWCKCHVNHLTAVYSDLYASTLAVSHLASSEIATHMALQGWSSKCVMLRHFRRGGVPDICIPHRVRAALRRYLYTAVGSGGCRVDVLSSRNQ